MEPTEFSLNSALVYNKITLMLRSFKTDLDMRGEKSISG